MINNRTAERLIEVLDKEYGIEAIEEINDLINNGVTLSEEDVYRLLKDTCHINNQNIFWNAVRADYLDLCKYVCDVAEVNLRSETKKGKAAIHLAASNGSVNVLRWLVEEKDIDLTTEDVHGMLPIHYAFEFGSVNRRVIKALVEDYHADLLVPSHKGLYPIHYLVCGTDDLDIEGFKKLVTEYKMDCRIRDENNMTPLDYSVIHRQCEVTKYLEKKLGKKCIKEAYETAFNVGSLSAVEFLQEDCGFDLKNEAWVEDIVFHDEYEFDYQLSLMDRLLKENECELFNYCYEKHYQDNFPTIGNSPVNAAREYKAYDTVEFFVKRYGKKTYINYLLRDKTDGVWNAFCEASRLDDISLLKYLVKVRHITLKGENVRENHLPPLYEAIKNDNIEIVRYLIEDCGCNPSCAFEDYDSPFTFAVKERQYEIADYLKTLFNPPCYSSILELFEDERLVEAFELIDKYNVNIDGLVCELCKTCNDYNFNKIPVLKKLVSEHTVNYEYKDETGKTSVVYAITNGALEIMQWMKEKCGIDFNDVEYKGMNALHLAALWNKHGPFMYIFHNSHLKINSKDKAGNTPLIYAVRGKQNGNGRKTDLRFLFYLITMCLADPLVVDNTGLKPVHIAVQNYRDDIVEWLITNGYNDVNEKDSKGKTVLQYAVETYCPDGLNVNREYPDSIQWLIDHGADVSVLDNNANNLTNNI